MNRQATSSQTSSRTQSFITRPAGLKTSRYRVFFHTDEFAAALLQGTRRAGARRRARHAARGWVYARGFRQAAGRHLLDLEPGDAVQRAHRRAGAPRRRRRRRAPAAKAVIFNTITVSDAISMGTEGMKYSLVSREVIADSIETVVGGEGFDGLVAIGGCDKNMPACVMAMARLNRPAVFVYGGTILPGRWRDQPGRYRLGVRSGRAACRRPPDRRRSRRPRSARLPRRRVVRRNVHRQHDGLGDRGARLEPAQQLGASRDFEGEARGLCARRRRGREPARTRHSPARHSDAQGIRERDHDGHRTRRLDQRRAASAGHCRCRTA